MACTSRGDTPDALEEMFAASCEKDVRCNCRPEEPPACEAYARQRAQELRQEGAERGAVLLDEACATIVRENAEAVCVDGGLPYAIEYAEQEAIARHCQRTLLHGERRLGEACAHPGELWPPRYGDCEIGTVCVEDGEGARCIEWPMSLNDGVCKEGDAAVGCPVDQACVPVDDDTSTCQPLTRVGDPCIGFSGDFCKGPPGQWCDLETSTCRALPNPGEPCLERSPGGGFGCAGGLQCDATCIYTAYCREGLCARRSEPGESCSGYGACALGLECEDGVCVGDEACGAH